MSKTTMEELKRRWATERRLSFIDFRLCWEGRINRSDIIEKFGISPQQASADLQEYLQLAPSNAEYDRSAKVYVATERFQPRLIPNNASLYLNELRALAAGAKDEQNTYIGLMPSFGITPVIERQVEAGVLKAVLEAIRAKSAIEIQYQSFSDPAPQVRWISPHALGYASHRWHARAYCHKDDKYKDFVLARIIGCKGMKPSQGELPPDQEWQSFVEVRFGPHPDLSEEMRRRIEWDYGMDNGVRILQVREALVRYFLNELLLDAESEKLDPKRRQIALLNAKELASFRRFA